MEKSEDELVRELLLLKGPIKTTRWTEAGTSASLLNGEDVISGNLNFSINAKENNAVKVIEHKRARQFTGRFLSQGLIAKNILDQSKLTVAHVDED